MLTPQLQLTDFNDLFVIAVGLTATYIAFVSSRSTAFLDILSRITSYAKNMALKKKEKPQQEENVVIARIEYFFESGLLQPETKGALKLVIDKAKEVMQHIQEVETWAEKTLSFHTQPKYLRVVSCVCFFFSFLALFFGALEQKCQYEIGGLLQIMILYIAVCLLHCLIYEHIPNNKESNHKKGEPNIAMHFILFVIAVIIGIRFHDQEMVCLSGELLAKISVLTCFCGFVAYFLMNIIVNLILLVVIPHKISLLNITNEVESQKRDIQRFQSELDSIELKLSQEKINLQVEGEAKNTVS